jgi:hypothetical protein
MARRSVSIEVRPNRFHPTRGTAGPIDDLAARVWLPHDQPWSPDRKKSGLRGDYRRLGDVSAVLDRDRLHRWHVTITTLRPGSWAVDESAPVVHLGEFRSVRRAKVAADKTLEHRNETGKAGCSCAVIVGGGKRQASLLDPECPVHRNRETKPRRMHLVPLSVAR